MSGFALFVVLYLFNAQTFLIDKNVFAWDSSAAAIVASLVYLVMGWVVYDGICRAFGQRKNGDLIVGVLVFVYVIAATFIACHLFAGRAPRFPAHRCDAGDGDERECANGDHSRARRRRSRR